MQKKTWNDFSDISPPFVDVEGSKITFNIQDGPVEEVGVNGCQIDKMGEVWLNILQKFNAKIPCRENSIAITKIEEALMWQMKRRENRVSRCVEGTNKK
jgi:hypothetical protein